MKYLFALLLTSALLACKNNTVSNEDHTAESAGTQVNAESPAVPDQAVNATALVGKQDVTLTIPGAEHIKKAYSYSVMLGANPSLFKCHFSQWKADNSLFFVSKFVPALSYRLEMNELKSIVAEADKDFNLDSLKTIGVGELIETGDLAITITKAYLKTYGDKNKKVNQQVDTFLLHSQLVLDFNALLNPYGLEVKQVLTEKMTFESSEHLTKHSVIESLPTDIPQNILNGIMYLKVGKI